MKRCVKLILISFLSFLFTINFSLGKIYECNYTDSKGRNVSRSFNSFFTNRPDYKELNMALKSGKCIELYIKKYFLDGTICSINFYKYNMKISDLTCTNNKQSALKKLKEIARKEYGYFGN